MHKSAARVQMANDMFNWTVTLLGLILEDHGYTREKALIEATEQVQAQLDNTTDFFLGEYGLDPEDIVLDEVTNQKPFIVKKTSHSPIKHDCAS